MSTDAMSGEHRPRGLRRRPRTADRAGAKGSVRRLQKPIFLGMMLTLLGLFLVTPNAVTLLIFVLGVVLIQIQVRLEEEFLSNTHGEEYAQYRRGVRRWL